jgi:hypothetical protein
MGKYLDTILSNLSMDLSKAAQKQSRRKGRKIEKFTIFQAYNCKKWPL